MKNTDFKPSWLVRTILSLLLIIVLGIGFLGYLTPGMRVNWETIATMCVF